MSHSHIFYLYYSDRLGKSVADSTAIANFTLLPSWRVVARRENETDGGVGGGWWIGGVPGVGQSELDL